MAQYKGVISGVKSRGKRPHNKIVVDDGDLRRGYQKHPIFWQDPDELKRVASATWEDPKKPPKFRPSA